MTPDEARVGARVAGWDDKEARIPGQIVSSARGWAMVRWTWGKGTGAPTASGITPHRLDRLRLLPSEAQQ